MISSSTFAKRALKKRAQSGFTLIEILVVIGIIALLATIVIVAINPARQFAQARDTQRTSNVNSILNAIGQRVADNKGLFSGSFTVGTDVYTCPDISTLAPGNDYDISSTTNAIAGTTVGLSCLTPTYIPIFPSDPKYTTGSLTLYKMSVDAAGRITIKAPSAEISVPISVTR